MVNRKPYLATYDSHAPFQRLKKIMCVHRCGWEMVLKLSIRGNESIVFSIFTCVSDALIALQTVI